MPIRAAAAVVFATVLTSCGAPDAGARVWQPRPGTTWQIQFSGQLDLSVEAEVFDLDGDTTPRSVVRRLHRDGRRVICYFSAGTYESFRADRELIPPETRGRPLADFPDEQWLDIRALEALRPMVESRLDTCRRKGFDAVDFDNVDGFTNETGFPLTGEDQLRFNRFLAAEAHERGLAAGLKNDLEQIPALVGDFEFQINEQCFEFDECERLLPFIRRRKAVFHIEYRMRPRAFCSRARRLGFSSIYKRRSLNAFRVAC